MALVPLSATLEQAEAERYAVGYFEAWDTYSLEAVNRDPYYRENLVLGDLPAGMYRVSIPYGGFLYEQEISILPGAVNYFSFRGFKGFEMDRPPTPEAQFTPDFP